MLFVKTTCHWFYEALYLLLDLGRLVLALVSTNCLLNEPPSLLGTLSSPSKGPSEYFSNLIDSMDCLTTTTGLSLASTLVLDTCKPLSAWHQRALLPPCLFSFLFELY